MQPQLINAPEEAHPRPGKGTIERFKAAMIGDVLRVQKAQDKARGKGKRSRAKPRISQIAQQFNAPYDDVDHLWGICILSTPGAYRKEHPRIMEGKINEFLKARPSLLAALEE